MNTITLFGALAKRLISGLVSVSLVLTSTLPATASAQALACDPVTAKNGTSTTCAVRDVGGVPITYPKFTWTQLGELATAQLQSDGTSKVIGGPQALELNNRTAMALGLDSRFVAASSSVFPGSVPYVLGRFNPTEGTLRIDIFKLEKTLGGSTPTVRMLTSQFTPQHGDAWRASRAYISPAEYRQGNVPGVNPFAAFIGPNDGEFHHISFNGAQVAMGHAMRAIGAGLGALTVADTRISTVTTKSGGVFKKTVRTYVYGHAKPMWYLAMPRDVLGQSTTQLEAGYCASNPNQEACPLYATAVSGVSFEQFSGGTLSDAEDQWQIDFMKQSGLTFVGALFLAVVASFAMAAMMGAAGIGAGAGAGAGSAGSTLMGQMTSWAVSGGVLQAPVGLLSSIAIEVGLQAGMLALGGANLGSLIKIDTGVLTGDVDVMKGVYDPPPPSKYDSLISVQVEARTVSSPVGSTLVGVHNTTFGGCAAGAPASSCVNTSGNVPRVDTWQESNPVEFVRDGNGSILRNRTEF